MRRSILVAIPVLGLAIILQTSVIERINLLNGAADLMMLIVAAWCLQERARGAWLWGMLGGLLVGFVSGIPLFVYLAGYLIIVAVARLLAHRVWQAPLLAMFTVTFLGTLLMHLLSFTYLRLFGSLLSLSDTMGLVTLPSVLLNLLVAIPLFGMMRDLARWVFPSAEPA